MATASQDEHDEIIRLHHVGYVVRSIEDMADRFALSIGAAWDRNVILDPLQAARVTFLGNGPPLVELVQPEGDHSPVLNFLKRGGGLHHLCYEVNSLERQLQASRAIGGTMVRAPLPAVAFQGRRVAWVVTKDRLLLEFLESSLQNHTIPETHP
jgi:methylmalonyl-CoA/ethylmalonyl-CoA epimerase